MIGGRIGADAFINLSNVAKSLSDYSMEVEGGVEEIVAINEDEEEESEEESEEDIVEVVEEEMEAEQKQGKSKEEVKKMEVKEEDDP